MTPLVGASGAYQVFSALLHPLPPEQGQGLRRPDTILYRRAPHTARLVLGFYLIVDNLLPVSVPPPVSVAYGAHIGGFLGGLAIAVASERFSWNWPWRDNMWRTASERPKETRTVDDPTNISALRASLRENSPSEAVEILRRMTPSEMSGLTPDECATLSGWLEATGHPIAASRLLRQCIARNPSGEGLADAYLTLGLMRLRQGQPTAAYQYLLAALESRPSPDTEARARQALNHIESRKKGNPFRD